LSDINRNTQINTLSGKTVVLKKVFGLNDPPLPSLYMLPKNSGKKIVNIDAKYNQNYMILL
jgi:hypothetical protein